MASKQAVTGSKPVKRTTFKAVLRSALRTAAFCAAAVGSLCLTRFLTAPFNTNSIRYGFLSCLLALLSSENSHDSTHPAPQVIKQISPIVVLSQLDRRTQNVTTVARKIALLNQLNNPFLAPIELVSNSLNPDRLRHRWWRKAEVRIVDQGLQDATQLL